MSVWSAVLVLVVAVWSAVLVVVVVVAVWSAVLQQTWVGSSEVL